MCDNVKDIDEGLYNVLEPHYHPNKWLNISIN